VLREDLRLIARTTAATQAMQLMQWHPIASKTAVFEPCYLLRYEGEPVNLSVVRDESNFNNSTVCFIVETV
jgi:hypothetical protein